MFRLIFLVYLVLYVTIALAEAKTKRSNLRDLLNDSNPSPRTKPMKLTCTFEGDEIDRNLFTCLTHNCFPATFSSTCSFSYTHQATRTKVECDFYRHRVEDIFQLTCPLSTCFSGGYSYSCTSAL